MSIERALSADVVPVLVVRTQGVDRTLQAGRSYRVGRDPQSDIVVDEPRVSWLHAILMVEHGRWLLADASSTNGTFLGRDRLPRIEISSSCEVRLGDPESGTVMSSPSPRLLTARPHCARPRCR